MADPLVSIVIPVFNGMAFLERAVDSVRSQKYSSIELTLVDGGSTDGSRDWVAESGLSHELLEAPSSPSNTWTTATNLARGEFVVLLCQDDLLYPEAIASQVAQLKGRSEFHAAIAQRDIIDATGAVVKRQRGLMGLQDGRAAGADVIRQCYLRGTNVIGEPHVVMFRREVIQGAMPWNGELPYFLDMATYAAALDRPGVLVHLRRESIGAFRVSSSSWSTRLVAEQLRQMRAWQAGYELSHRTNVRERVRAAANATIQAQARRAFYLMIRGRGRWTAA